ncbi:MAG: hypothetical protein JW797_18015 [Bradymonadales bacterium]|nr:hypothetical protein [Bradymonadales bacterium]
MCNRYTAAMLALLIPLAACNQPVNRPASRRAEPEAEAQAASDVPVTRVVLYRSGIAYVERQGQVEGDELKLQIRPDQINDILTTLTVIVDRGENVATSIALPIERSVAQLLTQLPPQVREQGGMLSLLSAFRGATATIRAGGDRATGRIVGTESLVNDQGNQIRRVALMTDEGALVQFRVDEIDEVSLQNEAIEVGLGKSLDFSLGEGDWKPVELTVRLSGEPPHEVAISYVVAMPTWKPTYRILVQSDALHLQGWSVVDNVSGESWNDISLSLVSGTPISFTYDLHSPHFVSRPDLTSRGFQDELALLAPTVDSGVRARPRRASPQGAAGYGGGGREELSRSAAPAEPMAEAGYYDLYEQTAMPEDRAPAITGEMMVGSLSANVSTEALGSLFRYDVGYPVSVADRGSALVTILNTPVEGEDVLYFDPSSPSPQAANHPYRTIRMVNNTPFAVERGPLSIYKEGTFVGQAIIPRVNEGELIFLPYSLEGRVRLDERQSTGQEAVQLVRIVNSIIFSEVQNIRRRTYQITNNTGEAGRLFIRLPKVTNWSLRTPDPDQAGVIDQGGVYYVPVELTEDLSREFVIQEVSTVTRQIGIFDPLAVETIGLYISDPDADPAIAVQLNEVLVQRARIAEIQADLQRMRGRRDDVYRRMSEIRQNLEALGDARQSQDLRRDLEGRLGEMEEQATELTIQIITLEEEESQLRAQISTALMDLSLVPDESEEEEEGE